MPGYKTLDCTSQNPQGHDGTRRDREQYRAEALKEAGQLSRESQTGSREMRNPRKSGLRLKVRQPGCFLSCNNVAQKLQIMQERQMGRRERELSILSL